MSSTSCEPQVTLLSEASSEVNHTGTLSDNLVSALFLNGEYSDVQLVVEGVSFPAHRIILASRSQYFRALLFGGMKETSQSEIELKAAPTVAFKILLKYIYSGRMTLVDLKEETILDILGLTHQWGFEELENSICEFLKLSLQVGNVCAILDTGLIFGLHSLVDTCVVFADKNAAALLDHPSFMTLSPCGVAELVSRDSFFASEEKIFEVVCEWVRRNSELHPNASSVLKCVRLPLMNLNTLLETVRPTGLVEPNLILDAIYNQSKTPRVNIRYRGLLIPEENMVNIQKGATVIKGEMKHSLLDGNIDYDVDKGFTRHMIDDAGDNGGGIVLKLGLQSILNHIRILLWDKDSRSYSYYVEVSMDQKDWVRVCDYTGYHCRSWQNIFFPKRVVRYIKVVGTHNTVNRMFHLVAIQAYFTQKEFTLDPKWGLLVPKENVATIELSACVIEGVSRCRNALINGETRGYDWDSGYTCHQLGSGSIIIQLAQPYIISSMRLLLWDLDDRYYSFYIEVSANQRKWEKVSNKSHERCQSWQVLRFEPIPVVYIRIVGTDNSANEVFHCVHFECPSQIQKEDDTDSMLNCNRKEECAGVSDPNSSTSVRRTYTGRGSNGSPSRLHRGSMNAILSSRVPSSRSPMNRSFPAFDALQDNNGDTDEDVGIEPEMKSEQDCLEVLHSDD